MREEFIFCILLIMISQLMFAFLSGSIVKNLLRLLNQTSTVHSAMNEKVESLERLFLQLSKTNAKGNGQP